MSLKAFNILVIATLISIGLESSAQQRSETSGGSYRGSSAGAPKLAKITGTVIDKSTNKPVEYANIAIFRTKDSTLVTGGISDNFGKFALEKVPYGSVTFKVRFIGYATSIVRDVKVVQPNIDLGKIDITPSSKNLSEVTVT